MPRYRIPAGPAAWHEAEHPDDESARWWASDSGQLDELERLDDGEWRAVAVEELEG